MYCRRRRAFFTATITALSGLNDLPRPYPQTPLPAACMLSAAIHNNNYHVDWNRGKLMPPNCGHCVDIRLPTATNPAYDSTLPPPVWLTTRLISKMLRLIPSGNRSSCSMPNPREQQTPTTAGSPHEPAASWVDYQRVVSRCIAQYIPTSLPPRRLPRRFRDHPTFLRAACPEKG